MNLRTSYLSRNVQFITFKKNEHESTTKEAIRSTQFSLKKCRRTSMNYYYSSLLKTKKFFAIKRDSGYGPSIIKTREYKNNIKLNILFPKLDLD